MESGVQYYTCAGIPQRILEDFCDDQQSLQAPKNSEIFDLTAACCCPPASRQSIDDSVMYQMNEPMYPCRPYSADNICCTPKKYKAKHKRKAKCKCCKQHVKKEEKEQTPEYYHPNIPWSGLPTTYDPCVHLHFKTKTVDRCDLTQEEYMDLLSTPKGYRWVGMCSPYKKRGYCKERKQKRCQKVKKQRKPRYYCTSSVPEDGLMRTLMGELCNVMSPEMMSRLRDILVYKFGLSKEDAGDYTSCDQYTKGKSIAKKECTVPRLSIRHKWVTDLSKVLADKLVDYILVTLAMKRTPRTKCIAETVLEHLCDITGIQTTMSTAKTEIEGLLVLIADRLALWIDGMVRDILRKRVRDKERPTSPIIPHKETRPEVVTSRPETAESRPETKESTFSEDNEESNEETGEENEERGEERNEDENEMEEEGMKEQNTENEEVTQSEEDEGEPAETESEDQVEEPEDEEYEAESEKENTEEWAEEEDIEMEELEELEEEFIEKENETELEDEETEEDEYIEEEEQVEEEESKPMPTTPVEEKRITPVVIPPLITAGKAFEVKAGADCHYEIKQLSSATVAQKVALAKGKIPPTIRKVPKTESPLNTKSLQEWAKWAKEVAGTAEQWGHWLDKTIVDVEKRTLLKHKAVDPSQAESYNNEYNQWLKEQQEVYTAFRVEKKRIKEDMRRWGKKIENKIKEDKNPEVETNVQNL